MLSTQKEDEFLGPKLGYAVIGYGPHYCLASSDSYRTLKGMRLQQVLNTDGKRG
jgi:hypothetical protein